MVFMLVLLCRAWKWGEKGRKNKQTSRKNRMWCETLCCAVYVAITTGVRGNEIHSLVMYCMEWFIAFVLVKLFFIPLEANYDEIFSLHLTNLIKCHSSATDRTRVQICKEMNKTRWDFLIFPIIWLLKACCNIVGSDHVLQITSSEIR